jgi:hypothetical protein
MMAVSFGVGLAPLTGSARTRTPHAGRAGLTARSVRPAPSPAPTPHTTPGSRDRTRQRRGANCGTISLRVSFRPALIRSSTNPIIAGQRALSSYPRRPRTEPIHGFRLRCGTLRRSDPRAYGLQGRHPHAVDNAALGDPLRPASPKREPRDSAPRPGAGNKSSKTDLTAGTLLRGLPKGAARTEGVAPGEVTVEAPS